MHGTIEAENGASRLRGQAGTLCNRTLQSVPDLSVRPCNNMSLLVFCQNPLQVSEQFQNRIKGKAKSRTFIQEREKNYLSCLVLPPDVHL